MQSEDTPKGDWKKDDLKSWLEKQGVTFENKKYLKKDYWELVKTLVQDDDSKYLAQQIMEKYNVKCLRLPP